MVAALSFQSWPTVTAVQAHEAINSSRSDIKGIFREVMGDAFNPFQPRDRQLLRLTKLHAAHCVLRRDDGARHLHDCCLGFYSPSWYVLSTA